METHQLGDPLTVLEILTDPGSKNRTELLIERLKGLGLLFCQTRQIIQNLLNQHLFQFWQQFVVLQSFSRDVQRQIGRIDDSIQESQVFWQQVTAVVLDQNSLGAQVDPMLDLTESHQFEI